ncbi:MAG: IPTL-CTERM sorting domain-containing protein, partial [Betaproteobacteria bacterium]
NGVNFPGTVVAGTGVHMGTGSVLTGRALVAAAGDVTMAGGNNVGGCSAAGAGLAAAAVSTVASPTVGLGAQISDTATLSGGGLGSAAPTGTITFNLFGPNDAACAGAVIFSSPVVVNGNGNYSSASFTPVAVGTYRWIANYSGDDDNAPTANVCNAAGESVIVTAGVLPPLNAMGGPTLSEWAMILLSGLLAIAGAVALRKQ